MCPRCETINVPDARYCVSCGEKLREPCVRCGSLNWVHAARCQHCGAALDLLEHIVLRHAETTAERLQRLQAEMPALKEEAERASQARLEKMWAQERERQAALAKAKAEQQRQERMLLIGAVAAVAVMLIIILILGLLSLLQAH